MARILVVGADATPQDRHLLQVVSQFLQDSPHEAIHLSLDVDAQPVRDMMARVQSADALVALLDDLTAPLALVLGLARASRRPVLGLRSDPRQDALPVPLRTALHDLVQVKEWTSDETRQAVLQFATAARVFAGALVRDAVPRLLKDEGRELRFRQVAESEYPPVLKRKLVETAQRLEEAEFGIEQEEIADVLELLETLINLRRYDRESLRSIKEGKWRKRGGFQKGFLVDEEPVLSR